MFIGKKTLAILCLTTALVSISLNTQAEESVSLEYQVKAAFILNFAKFVDWPSQTFSNTQSPVVIGVLGQNPFGGVLEETIQNQTLNSRLFIVKYSPNLQELKTCQIIFISQSEKGSVRDILSQLRGSSVLTVSDVDNFAENGGIIHFIREENKVRFEINREAAEQANLKISSKLLSLAQIVKPAPESGGGKVN